ncbi:unnamed protein product [Effrenium voratum]|nr:unnamed protein product [Effrenium voratum]
MELSDEEAKTVACELLALGAEDVLALHLTRWGKEPWALGSYSVSSKDSAWDDVRSLVTSMEGRRIRLAGEHTHDEHQGGFHAAYLSGLRAAEEILEGLAKDASEHKTTQQLCSFFDRLVGAMNNDDVSEGSRELVDLSAEAISSLGIHLSQIGQIISKSSMPPNKGDRSCAFKLKEKLEMYQA